ncbi:phosphatidylglycerol lysyltransferase domain-containing protein [Brucella neotomae]|uniref:phosphatidylglycerol lysyltransferase domain-containing protein n=1 Tax=Brucella neotomae TaxID=29460 RepID=UPI000D9EA956|nr:phosphatidylglycerol lysyltransferase domain-containing protein [Brucella neotomae]SPU66942.1 lysylphosphatidylglycerol synthetase [Brucella neotomae]
MERQRPGFLRATVLVFAVVAAVGLHSIINRHGQRRRKVDHSIPDAVPALVARCPHTDAALAMLGDKQFLLAPDDSAFIMYAQSGGSLIALGEPIGDAEAGKELAWSSIRLRPSGAAHCLLWCRPQSCRFSSIWA